MKPQRADGSLMARRLGEPQPRMAEYRRPVDRKVHGGYFILKAAEAVAGPYFWFENAVREAAKWRGLVTNRNWLRRHGMEVVR